MKINLQSILFMMSLILIGACDNESNVEPRDEQYFVKYYGDSGGQTGVKVIEVDNGFIMVGTSRLADEDNQIYVVGTDFKGNELWSNTFGRPNTDDVGRAIVQSSTGLVLVGNSFNDQGFSDILVYNLDNQGVKIDSVVVGDPLFNDEVNDVIITQSGNILLAGASSNASFGGAFDFYFPQLLPGLSLVPNWVGRYGFSGEDKANGVRENASGEFVFVGTTDKVEQISSDKAQTNMIMFQITSNGIPNIEGKTFGSTNKEVANSISNAADGGFLLVGSTSDDNNSDIFISRIRQNSDFLGSYTVNTDLNITGASITEAQGGGFIVLGDVITPTGTDIYMTKTTNDGADVWKRTFGFSGLNSAGGVLQLEDGSIVFIGTINLDNQSKMCLIKTNKNGDLEP
jgi:hypothetical protein